MEPEAHQTDHVAKETWAQDSSRDIRTRRPQAIKTGSGPEDLEIFRSIDDLPFPSTAATLVYLVVLHLGGLYLVHVHLASSWGRIEDPGHHSQKQHECDLDQSVHHLH